MRLSLFALVSSSLAVFGVMQVQGKSPTSAQVGPYEVRQVFHVGGEGGFDYLTVDPERGLLYVPRTTHTMVLDAATGKTVADIPGQQHNHGVAVVVGIGRGFISDGGNGAITIFDLKTNRVLGKVKAAVDADGIIYDPVSRKVLVSCGDAGVLIPISADVAPKTGRADPPVVLGGKPEFLVAAEGKAYVNLVDKDRVAVVDTRTMKVIHKWPTAPGGSPVGMSMDTVRHRLFIGCRKPQKLVVMNSDSGTVLADLPIGAGNDATQFDGDAFASCRDGTLAVARETSPGKFAIIQTVHTRQGAKTMGIDPKTHTLYLPTAEFGHQKDANSRPIAKPGSFVVLVVGQCDERANMHDGIPKEWLGSPASAQHAEEDNMVNGVPFGSQSVEWKSLKAAMIEGDEIWGFCSPPDSWRHLSGRGGYAIVRKGKVVRSIVTLKN